MGLIQGRATMQKDREKLRNSINEILVHLFNEIMELEENAVITDEFSDLTNNDMHVIEAIGRDSDSRMSQVARRLKVTAGTLTIAVNGLVRKEYVERLRSEEDRRIVLICLTQKGRRAYDHHEDFHRRMTEAAMEVLTEEEIPVLTKTLDSLVRFFKQYRH